MSVNVFFDCCFTGYILYCRMAFIELNDKFIDIIPITIYSHWFQLMRAISAENDQVPSSTTRVCRPSVPSPYLPSTNPTTLQWSHPFLYIKHQKSVALIYFWEFPHLLSQVLTKKIYIYFEFLKINYLYRCNILCYF